METQAIFYIKVPPDSQFQTYQLPYIICSSLTQTMFSLHVMMNLQVY